MKIILPAIVILGIISIFLFGYVARDLTDYKTARTVIDLDDYEVRQEVIIGTYKDGGFHYGSDDG